MCILNILHKIKRRSEYFYLLIIFFKEKKKKEKKRGGGGGSRLFPLKIVTTPEVNDHEIGTFKAPSVWNVGTQPACVCRRSTLQPAGSSRVYPLQQTTIRVLRSHPTFRASTSSLSILSGGLSSPGTILSGGLSSPGTILSGDSSSPSTILSGESSSLGSSLLVIRHL